MNEPARSSDGKRRRMASMGNSGIGTSGETDRVAVGVADDEGVAAPALLLEALRQRHAGGDVLREQRANVVDLDERHDEALTVLDADGEHRLVDELQMQGGAVARDRSVERRIAVEEVDREAERVAIELRGRGHVGDEQNGDGAHDVQFLRMPTSAAPTIAKTMSARISTALTKSEFLATPLDAGMRKLFKYSSVAATNGMNRLPTIVNVRMTNSG